MNFTDFTAEFFSRFGKRSIQPVLGFSQGRVNSIGEQKDYNSGYGRPCARDFGTFMAVRFNDSERSNMASMNFD
ncbi:MAG: galactokinase, partial [Bacteroidales bacterium]|nr:galactokinase [Bacteroidales bacterium]